MKLDLKALCLSLEQAEAKDSVPITGCNSYLLEHVIRPMMWGREIRIRDIDFSRFEVEDIADIAQYSEDLSRCAWRLEQLTGAVAKLEPAAQRIRQFC